MAFAPKRNRWRLITDMPVKFVVRPAEYFVPAEHEESWKKAQDKYECVSIPSDKVGKSFAGAINEINNFGMFIATDAALSPMTRVELNFKIPGKIGEIDAVGFVVWSRKEAIRASMRSDDLVAETLAGMDVPYDAPETATIEMPKGLFVNFEYMSLEDHKLYCDYMANAAAGAMEGAITSRGLPERKSLAKLDTRTMNFKLKELEEKIAPLALSW